MPVLRPLAPLVAGAKKDTALIILNRPLEGWLLKQLWSVSVLKAVTDGGVDRLRACVGETDGETESYIPDLITGDFDSASPATLQFYREKKVEIIPTPDQDATDFTKCLTHVISTISTRTLQVSRVVVVGGMGGRADHYFSNIHTLYLASQLTTTPVYLMGEGNALCLLHKGKTTIMADTGLEDAVCGLLPIGCRCDHVTTTGLQWNLDNQPLAFGELVGSSNTYQGQGQGQVEGRAVTVETDKPLLWTMTFTSPQ